MIEKEGEDGGFKSELLISGNKATGTIYKKKELLGKFYGKLDSQITFTDSTSKTKKETIIFDFKKIKKDKIQVEDLKNQMENESRKVWHPVTKEIFSQNGEKATEEKLRIEQEQREKRKKFEETGEEYKPKYFEEKEKNWFLIQK